MSQLQWIGLFLLALLVGCETENPQKLELIKGETMGTTYSIKLPYGIVSQSSIDSILIEINQSVSTYDPESLISGFNRDSLGVILALNTVGLGHFQKNIEISNDINKITTGAFDPSVMPLVNLWGFGYQDRSRDEYPDSSKVDSVMALIGYSNFQVMLTDSSYNIEKAFYFERG